MKAHHGHGEACELVTRHRMMRRAARWYHRIIPREFPQFARWQSVPTMGPTSQRRSGENCWKLPRILRSITRSMRNPGNGALDRRERGLSCAVPARGIRVDRS